MGRLNLASVASVCLAFVTSACSVSDSDERQMGSEYARQIGEQLPLVTDARITGYVSALGKQIARGTSRAGLDWQFFVVDSRDVNAFALPGGFIYVNRGLIERADRLDHLAGVLGHEIGHVVERHSVEQLQKSTGTSVGLMLLCMLTSICEGAVGQIAVNVAGSALLARYSRSDEAEADSQAVVNVINAGISPHGIPEFFQVLMSERRRDPNLLDSFLASHPLEESRVLRTRSFIETFDPARLANLTRDDPGFRQFKAAVEALPPAPQPRPFPR